MIASETVQMTSGCPVKAASNPPERNAMFCAKCGNEIADDNQFCPKCGTKVEAAPAAASEPTPEPAPAAQQGAPVPPAASEQQGTPVPPAPAAPNASQAGYQAPPAPASAPAANSAAVYPMSSQDETLRLIAFILNVISCVALCWLIIPLAWLVPMTVHSWGIYKGTKPNTVAFGVCTLIFASLIAGILLLVSKKDNE